MGHKGLQAIPVFRRKWTGGPSGRFIFLQSVIHTAVKDGIANMSWVQQLLSHAYYLGDKENQQALLQRLERYFTKNKKVAEKTIGHIRDLINA